MSSIAGVSTHKYMTRVLRREGRHRDAREGRGRRAGPSRHPRQRGAAGPRRRRAGGADHRGRQAARRLPRADADRRASAPSTTSPPRCASSPGPSRRGSPARCSAVDGGHQLRRGPNYGLFVRADVRCRRMPRFDRHVTHDRQTSRRGSRAGGSRRRVPRRGARVPRGHASLRQGFGDTDASRSAPPTRARRPSTRTSSACRAWQRTLFENGWAGIAWPKEYGGRGGSSREARIFAQEESQVRRVGSAVQRSRSRWSARRSWRTAPTSRRQFFLTRDARAATTSGASSSPSPAPGSDLAGLTTRAERDGDEWVVNGQKVWTSGAHYSDYGHAARPHRLRRAEAPGHHLLPARHAARRASRCGR